MSGMEASVTDRAVIAHHEAGHAVTAVLRGGNVIEIEVTQERQRKGLTVYETANEGDDKPWVAFAGPWAEARYSWPDLVLDSPLAVHPANGLSFIQHLLNTLCPDKNSWQQDILGFEESAFFDDPRNWPFIAMELEAYWPTVRAIAQRLLDGREVTSADIWQELIEGAHRSQDEGTRHVDNDD